MKRIVLDTNVFLVSIGQKSKYHWIFKALLERKYSLIVTTPILLEYYEYRFYCTEISRIFRLC